MRTPAWLLAATAALLLTVAGAPAMAAPGLENRLERDLGPAVDVEVSDETGRVSFIGAPRRDPIAVAAGGGPASAALAFARRHAAALGLSADAGGLRSAGSGPGPNGATAVRLEQRYVGLPVIGGELMVNVTPAGDVLSLLGEASPVGGLPTDPAVPATEALDTALGLTAKEHGTTVSELAATAPRLSVYDPRLLGAPGPAEPSLAWQLEVSRDGPVDDVRQFVVVDARTGRVLLDFGQIPHADADQAVCDAMNTPSDVPCLAPDRVDGGPPSIVPDVNSAFEHAEDTYDFFNDTLGRSSIDGEGMQIRSTVRYCDPDETCPYPNAFWNGSQVVFGEGYAGADDVVAHELAHGVTEFTADLFYYYQSGAINESLSDVFGEFVDQTNLTGSDDPADRWLIGEDLPPGDGPIRDMERPTDFGHPDSMTSPHYEGDPGDDGGVHTNSGVSNKAAFLMTDGGSFNGRTVSPLGLEKVARLYYTVETTMLTSGSDYADLGNALGQACSNLVGSFGFTSGDCGEVADAVLATRMLTDPPAAPAPEAPVCAGGQAPFRTVFADGMEGGGWTSTDTGVWDYDRGYASEGDRMLYGFDGVPVSDASMISPSFTLPRRAELFMRFSHAYGFEQDPGRNYDGGVLEYSTDGGSTWTDAAPLFTDNGYSGGITAGTGNPLGGRDGFVGLSNGYRSSRLDLESLAGRAVRVRFRLATDNSVRDLGWVVDDVRVYACPDSTPPQTSFAGGPRRGATLRVDTARFRLRSNEPGVTFRCRLDRAPRFRRCGSSPRLHSLHEGRHTLRVRAVDAAGNRDPTPARRSFTVRTPRPDVGRVGLALAFEKATLTFGGRGLRPLRFRCRLDRGRWQRCRSPQTYRDLDPGPHLFEVQAIDRLGRRDRSPARKRFTLPG